MQVRFQLIRQRQDTPPRVQTYLLDTDPNETILNCLNRIKWEQDGSLAFRKNCRNTICGSCGMRVNGRSILACKENLGSELERMAKIAEARNEGNSSNDEIPEITIAPMGNMPVIKDLVVDMSGFWQGLEAIEPYISTAARQVPEREFLQSPQEREKLDRSGNCILCGACYSECNAREVDANFVGPHALAKAYRTIADSRDDRTEQRLDNYNQTSGAWGCTRCFYCNEVCPMEVEPMDRIGQIKGEILDRHAAGDSRAIRHRKTLVELVKQGGWVDERKFGVLVIGNYFRDLKGLLSLLPVGLRMVSRRKLPTTFDPSEGTSQVRSLIESVQNLERKSSQLKSMSASETPSPEQPETKAQSDENVKSEPEQSDNQLEPRFGWTLYAEQINGRFAMIGFVLLLLIEIITHQDLFTWLGLR
jgi:succinate dehydrogenase / fumarate reductase iron-sulfur subunit